jgi:putative Mn2+ efflux pump MntP
MGLPEIFLIAVGLSMDAFAVSITIGLSAKEMKHKEILIPGLYFGFFQALMPALGFFAGIFFAEKIQFLDHWITFVLLGILGGKMIKDSFSKEDKKTAEHSFKFITMLVLAIATSIDALAVGITYSFFKINIFTAILITGITTFVISTCGVKIGIAFGSKFQSKAEFFGGAVLVAIGVKILIEHLFFH